MCQGRKERMHLGKFGTEEQAYQGSCSFWNVWSLRYIPGLCRSEKDGAMQYFSAFRISDAKGLSMAWKLQPTPWHGQASTFVNKEFFLCTLFCLSNIICITPEKDSNQPPETPQETDHRKLNTKSKPAAKNSLHTSPCQGLWYWHPHSVGNKWALSLKGFTYRTYLRVYFVLCQC